jgi:hypothetical protein
MKKPLLIFAVAAQLALTSACNIIPDFPSASSVKNEDEETERRQMLEIKAITEEWKVMKPALVNLVALESDLQYMLSNIEQGDDKLMNTTKLQSSIEMEEKVAAYETMSFSEGENISSDFAQESQELEKLSKVSVFADAALLDKLKISADKIATNLPIESIEQLAAASEADIFKPAENSQNINKNNDVDVAATAPVAEYLLDKGVAATAPVAEYLLDKGVAATAPVAEYLLDKGVAATAPVAEYLLEKDVTFKTRPIPDILIVGAAPNSNAPILAITQNQYRESKPGTTTKFDNTSLQRQGIDAKFSTQRGAAHDLSSNSYDAKSTKFQVQNQDNGGKFSIVELGELSDPSNIVGTVNYYTAVNSNSKNLKLDNSCSMTKTAVGDGYALHLASYRSLDNALKGWESLSNKYSKELCGLVALTEKVSVNSKQFFSLRAGGFETKDVADDACAQLTNKNQYCRSIRFTGDRLP